MRVLLKVLAALLQPICLLLGTSTYLAQIALLRIALAMHDGYTLGEFIGSCIAFFLIASTFFSLTVWSVRILKGEVSPGRQRRSVELRHIREAFAVDTG